MINASQAGSLLLLVLLTGVAANCTTAECPSALLLQDTVRSSLRSEVTSHDMAALLAENRAAFQQLKDSLGTVLVYLNVHCAVVFVFIVPVILFTLVYPKRTIGILREYAGLS